MKHACVLITKKDDKALDLAVCSIFKTNPRISNTMELTLFVISNPCSPVLSIVPYKSEGPRDP